MGPSSGSAAVIFSLKGFSTISLHVCRVIREPFSESEKANKSNNVTDVFLILYKRSHNLVCDLFLGM